MQHVLSSLHHRCSKRRRHFSLWLGLTSNKQHALEGNMYCSLTTLEITRGSSIESQIQVFGQYITLSLL